MSEEKFLNESDDNAVKQLDEPHVKYSYLYKIIGVVIFSTIISLLIIYLILKSYIDKDMNKVNIEIYY